MTTEPLRGYYEEQIQDERYEIWKHIFIKDYFQLAQRINDGKSFYQ